MKSTSIRSSILATLAAASVVLATASPAKAYSYYVWNQQTVDQTERACAQKAYRALRDAGYDNARADNGFATGDRNGVTMNVHCIKAANGRISAILYSIGDDNNSVKFGFDFMKKAVYSGIRYDNNP